MNTLAIHTARRELRREICAWQKAALGLLALSLAWGLCQEARIGQLEAQRRETAAALEQAEQTRDLAVRELGALVLRTEEEAEARMEQAAAFEAVGAYRYIGECTITAYCPCAECCGKYADGLTATGIPVGPGIVAVDRSVIPLGSTVVIDGQKYLAADTGVEGRRVDICMATHEEAEAFGVRTAEVWTEALS